MEDELADLRDAFTFLLKEIDDEDFARSPTIEDLARRSPTIEDLARRSSVSVLSNAFAAHAFNMSLPPVRLSFLRAAPEPSSFIPRELKTSLASFVPRRMRI